MRRAYAQSEADYPITTGLAVGAGATPSMMLSGQFVPLVGAVPAAEAAAARSGIPLLVRNAPILGRAAAGSVNAAGGGLALGIGASNETDPIERIREGLGTAAGGAALGWLAPIKPPVLAERAALKATDVLERKAAEKGLQALAGGRGNAKRLARAMAREDANRPVEAGLEAFRSTDLPSGFQAPDQLAASLAAAERQAGADVGSIYGQATAPTVPKAQVTAAVQAPARALSADASTEEASRAAVGFLDRAVEKARLRTLQRVLQQDPTSTGPEGRLAAADLQALRRDIDTQARGWQGSARPQDTAAADALNQARGALNQQVLQPAMNKLGLGLEARAADARFGRIADAATVARSNASGGVFGAEDALTQAERVLSPAGSLLAQTGEAVAGRPGQAALGLMSTINKATLNNPRWTQRQGRALYGELLKAYQGTPGAPPPRAPQGAAALSPEIQALINAMFGPGRPGMALPAPADDRGSR